MLGGALAHDMNAQGGVRDLGGDIGIEAALAQHVEEFREALPGPGQALGQHHLGEVFHPFHQRDQDIPPLRQAGREADAAIPDQGSGDPVPGGAVKPRRPRRLSVIMGVDVDKARGDQLAPGVDLRCPARGRGQLPHRQDAALANGDIGLIGRSAQAIGHRAAADDEIGCGRHGVSPGWYPPTA